MEFNKNNIKYNSQKFVDKNLQNKIKGDEGWYCSFCNEFNLFKTKHYSCIKCRKINQNIRKHLFN